MVKSLELTGEKDAQSVFGDEFSQRNREMVLLIRHRVHQMGKQSRIPGNPDSDLYIRAHHLAQLCLLKPISSK
jgi:hypothetical protein